MKVRVWFKFSMSADKTAAVKTYFEEGSTMPGPPSGIRARLFRAQAALQDGRTDEGIEELRQGIFEAARHSPAKGRKLVEEILHFAHENEIFGEIEETLEDEPLRRYLFGDE